MSQFGTLVSGWQVEQAIRGLFTSQMLDFYLSEVERQHGLTVPTLQRPRSVQAAYDLDNWSEAQLPALIIVCPGTAEDPMQFANFYAAWFEARIAVLVEDTTEAETRRVAQLHQAAFDGILVQNADLGGFATDLQFISRSTELPDVDNRTLAYSESVYRVLVSSVVQLDGPGAPPSNPEDPVPDLPTVATTNLTFQAVPDDQQP